MKLETVSVIEAVDRGDARGARGHRVVVVGLELEEVEVISAVVDRGGLGHGALGGAEEGESGRQGEGFLAAGEEDIDAEFVDLDGHDGEARDGVGDEEDVVVFADDGGDFGEGVHHSRRGLVVDEGDEVELTGGEFRVDRGGIDRDTPFELERLGFFAATACDIDPLVGKGARAAAKDLFRGEVADRPLHHAPGGGGREENGLGSAHEGLETRLDRVIEGDEVLAAVTDHGSGHRRVARRRDLDGARDVESDVLAHLFAEFGLRRGIHKPIFISDTVIPGIRDTVDFADWGARCRWMVRKSRQSAGVGETQRSPLAFIWRNCVRIRVVKGAGCVISSPDATGFPPHGSATGDSSSDPSRRSPRQDRRDRSAPVLRMRNSPG